MKHLLSSGCYTNQTKPRYTNMIEYFPIIPVSSTSTSTSYPALHAEAFAHPSVRPITRCAQQHVPAWSHGCLWVKSWLLHNDIHRHQAAAWLVLLDVASYIVHVFAIASQHCCLLLQSRFPKKQRAKVSIFCKGLEHMESCWVVSQCSPRPDPHRQVAIPLHEWSAVVLEGNRQQQRHLHCWFAA